MFARRAVQRLIDEVRPLLGAGAIGSLVNRLNRAGADQLAAMWEVAVLASLAKRGNVDVESGIQSGRRPDVRFSLTDTLSFTADITVVSDDGIEDQNPVRAFCDIIEQMKTRLGLPVGGINLQVAEKTEVTKRGKKRILRLPPKERLQDYVNSMVEPEIRRQLSAGITHPTLAVNDETAAFDLTIGAGPYTTMGYGGYNYPTMLDKNPLFSALKAKAKQLKGAEGIRGIFVIDGGCSAFASFRGTRNNISAVDIATDFLRQNTSIDFVLMISGNQKPRSWLSANPAPIELVSELIVQRWKLLPPELSKILCELTAAMPIPIKTPINAYHSARAKTYGLGHHGGLSMSNHRIKISAREVMEVLSGRTTVQELNERYSWSGLNEPPKPNTMRNPFDLFLSNGRLPSKITIEDGNENKSDNWIEIEFGDIDPAISRFK